MFAVEMYDSSYSNGVARFFSAPDWKWIKMDGDGSTRPALWRVATAIYIRAMHFHRRIDNASVRLSVRGARQSEIKFTCS